MSIERTITQLLLSILGDSQDILEKFGVSSFTLTGISHLSHLLHKHSDRLAVFEWAAFFECRALASQTFIRSNCRIPRHIENTLETAATRLRGYAATRLRGYAAT